MRNILIVDDDPKIRELVSFRLKSNGYSTTEASNGVEAFGKIDTKPDLIVLDAAMPMLDGYQFIQATKWRDEFKGIPIVVLTARAHTKTLFEDLGIAHFLTKPFNTQELLTLIDQSISN